MSDSPLRAFNYHAAKRACQYAQRFIVKGSTQTITNTYSFEQRISLDKAIADLRDNAVIKSPYDLESNHSIRIFYQIIELSKKLSLGNCSELAFLSMEYLINCPGVRAEVFTLSGGDHTFLVIGRNPASLPDSPKTWGKNAFICDPWMGKVYPAYKYTQHLRNYYSTSHPNKIKTDFLNHTEKFDPIRHMFKPLDTLTTSYLQIADSLLHKNEIVTIFKKRANEILRAIQSLLVDLQNIATAVTSQYGGQDAKGLIIVSLINHLSAQASQIKTSIQHPLDCETHYLKLRSQLQASLKEHIHQYWKVITLPEKDKKTLSDYHYPKSLWMRLFNKSPEAAQKVIDRLDGAKDELRTLVNNS